MGSTAISHTRTVTSKFFIRSMSSIVTKYEIDPKFHPRLPEVSDVITDAPNDFVWGVSSVL